MKKKILLYMPMCLLVVGCGKQLESKDTKLSLVEGSYTIDVHSYTELAGNADYVIVGKVVKELDINYRWPVMVENEDGSKREESVPYTDYNVEVIDI